MSYILSLSTSSKQGSFSIAKDRKVLYSLAWQKANAHAEVLTHFLNEAFHFLEIKPAQIKLFICDIGPGSFTGVRVATATIKSLAYHAKESRILPCTANELLIQNLYLLKKPICTLINAQRQEFYASFYEPGKTKMLCKRKVQLMNINKIEKYLSKNHILLGDGSDIFLNNCKESVKKKCIRFGDGDLDYPLAKNAFHLLESKNYQDRTIDWKSLEPLYIRASSAEEKLISGDLKSARNYVRRKDK